MLRRRYSGPRKGGRTTLLKYGRQHFRDLAARSHQVPRERQRPPFIPLNVRLTPPQVRELAAISKKSGRSRAGLIRQALDWWLVNEMGRQYSALIGN